jgi:glycine/D-amino acid oxidase-like deaminating enzyme
MSQSPRGTVVGAGIVGAAVAWPLARRGARLPRPPGAPRNGRAWRARPRSLLMVRGQALRARSTSARKAVGSRTARSASTLRSSVMPDRFRPATKVE